MQLAENIKAYYYDHFDQLDTDKQFHFASRLAAWNGDSRAHEYLSDHAAGYLPNPCTKETLKAELDRLINNPPDMPANAAALRNAYFEQYGWLRGLELGLFRVRHWLELYGVDARPALFDLVPRRTLIAYKDQLLQDEQAMRMLSTYAINYIYLLERVILQNTDEQSINMTLLLRIGEAYDTSDILQHQLMVYYYTHCVIGETNFYARDIRASRTSAYQEMLARVDAAISGHFESASLDTKLEFLVCARLSGYSTTCEPRIMQECGQSISPEGTFLVDTVNAFADRDYKKTFSASEHRNVLFIMANTPRVLPKKTLSIQQ